ncbi:hypothetical protein C900_00228 [Fulvivirga imtechensis AK7]|uniref:Uncharacterized protein n=1 Tax=Fulvivirga imtechensis AK7 TaxID=1237149 RepID=L8JIC8_9BACT|nr:hypothetical protein C900_00228 [Fulvivirga imtechensis AK7]
MSLSSAKSRNNFDQSKQLACIIFLKAKSLQRSRQATNVVQAFTLQKNGF